MTGEYSSLYFNSFNKAKMRACARARAEMPVMGLRMNDETPLRDVLKS